jgi:hypothetical protein
MGVIRRQRDSGNHVSPLNIPAFLSSRTWKGVHIDVLRGKHNMDPGTEHPPGMFWETFLTLYSVGNSFAPRTWSVSLSYRLEIQSSIASGLQVMIIGLHRVRFSTAGIGWSSRCSQTYAQAEAASPSDTLGNREAKERRPINVSCANAGT